MPLSLRQKIILTALVILIVVFRNLEWRLLSYFLLFIYLILEWKVFRR